MSSENELKQIVEAALLAAGRPLSLEQLQALFDPETEPDRQQLRDSLNDLAEDYAGRGIELKEVGSGFRIQVRSEYAPWVSRLYAESASQIFPGIAGDPGADRLSAADHPG